MDDSVETTSESGDALSVERPSDGIPFPALGIWIVSFILFGAGTALAVGLYFQDAVPAQRINSTYLPSECEILATKVERVKVHDYHPGKSGISNEYEDPREFGYAPSVHIKYFVSGTEYETWTFDGGAGDFKEQGEAQAAVAEFVAGESRKCWYDPDDPSQVVIRRLSSYRQNYTGVVVAGVMGLVGLLGLLYCLSRSVRVLLKF